MKKLRWIKSKKWNNNGLILIRLFLILQSLNIIVYLSISHCSVHQRPRLCFIVRTESGTTDPPLQKPTALLKDSHQLTKKMSGLFTRVSYFSRTPLLISWLPWPLRPWGWLTAAVTSMNSKYSRLHNSKVSQIGESWGHANWTKLNCRWRSLGFRVSLACFGRSVHQSLCEEGQLLSCRGGVCLQARPFLRRLMQRHLKGSF